MAPDEDAPAPAAGNAASPSPEGLEPSPEERRIAGSPHAVAANLAVLGLTRAARSFTLYDPANKVVRTLIADYRDRFRAVLDGFGPLVLEVHPFEMTLGREVVYLERDRERSLAFRLFRDGVRKLAFAAETTWDELLRLLQILSIRYTGVRQQEDDLVTLLRKGRREPTNLCSPEVPLGLRAGPARAAGTRVGARATVSSTWQGALCLARLRALPRRDRARRGPVGAHAQGRPEPPAAGRRPDPAQDLPLEGGGALRGRGARRGRRRGRDRGRVLGRRGAAASASAAGRRREALLPVRRRAAPVDLWFLDLASQRVRQFVGRGSGGLTALEGREVEASGRYAAGEWQAVFVRSLRSTNGVSFAEGQYLPVAFSVWDGTARERGNRRGLTRWFYVYLPPREKPSVVGPMLKAAFGVLALELLVVAGLWRRKPAGAPA